MIVSSESGKCPSKESYTPDCCSVSEYYEAPTKRVRLVQNGHHYHLIKCNLLSP